ncbi:threonine/serine exporter family protein [Lentilactobacillus sp. SPB1-3]|uniref:Threonine/serine exporter family protein n=1 Tax=Lentilactobacillus terminaliae TaxID=3003483 RepID=A0ACD5DG53_9LACO|nr:threonine/serine exporter family protein [Lentilactobacillus sp. SPB1-3]MCZ0976725.1 threonine/serine exporter family protein [Lentilactobacillus sp. SPB1-3]
MAEFDEFEQRVIDTCVLAGTIMIESGSEMNRVNDTINRIATNAGLPDVAAYVTLTGIIMSGSNGAGAKVGQIEKREFDMEKVAKVNELSRDFAQQKIDIDDFNFQLKHIDEIINRFPIWLQMLGAALISGPLVVVFRNDPQDLITTGVIGMIGWSIYYFLSIYIRIRFLSEFLAAVVIAGTAIMSVKLGLGFHSDDIIIGAMMPLVPGIPITNAVRDALSGNLISGPARGIEALISACALGFGVAIGLHFF